MASTCQIPAQKNAHVRSAIPKDRQRTILSFPRCLVRRLAWPLRKWRRSEANLEKAINCSRRAFGCAVSYPPFCFIGLGPSGGTIDGKVQSTVKGDEFIVDVTKSATWSCTRIKHKPRARVGPVGDRQLASDVLAIDSEEELLIHGDQILGKRRPIAGSNISDATGPSLGPIRLPKFNIAGAIVRGEIEIFV